jgi:hypothetical protein
MNLAHVVVVINIRIAVKISDSSQMGKINIFVGSFLEP